MDLATDYAAVIAEHWTIWLVSVVLIVAAVIDGYELRVPNLITYPFIIAGWVYSTYAFGLQGLGWSLAGTALGMSILMAFHAIGGMGAGDVKLMGGVGAWIYWTHTWYCIIGFALVGAVMAIVMIVVSGKWKHHYNQFWKIVNEITTIKDPAKLSALAAERKPNMMLLPYGIPIAIATISYFLWTGMLV
ncbi:MAG TPA: A24 family peptidase [Pirellulaceae bacterium]|nr:A24 family peptidase [Pirellulaceae bacterium]